MSQPQTFQLTASHEPLLCQPITKGAGGLGLVTNPSSPLNQGAPHLQAGGNTLSAPISPFQSPLPRPALSSPAIPGSAPSGDALLRDGPAGLPQPPWEAETPEASGVLFSGHVIPRVHMGSLGV